MAEQTYPQFTAESLSPPVWLATAGSMGELIARMPWHNSPFGAIASWPDELLHALRLTLSAAFPIAIHWGEEQRMLYNDAWAQLIGTKHPAALGQPAAEVFAEIWHDLDPIFAATLRGETVLRDNQPFPIDRGTGDTEAYFTFSNSPLRNVHDDVVGMVTIATDTTANTIGTRRRNLIADLNQALAPLVSPPAIQATAARVLAHQLGADRVLYAEVLTDRGYCQVLGGYEALALSSGSRLAGRAPLTYLEPNLLAQLQTGTPVSVTNVFTASVLNEVGRARALERGVQALVVAPLIKGDKLVAVMVVEQGQPRSWKESERLLISAAADRTWSTIEQARAELARRRTELRFRQLADAMPQLVWIGDADGTLRYYNARVSEYRGIAQQADGSWQWEDSVHPDDQAAAFGAWREALSTLQPLQIEHRIQMADGSWRWHLTRSHAASDQDGNTTWFGTSTDIHELRAAAEALAASEELFRHLADGIPHLVWLADADGQLEFFNQRYREYTGVEFRADNAAELLPAHCHPDDLAPLTAAWQHAHNTRRPFLFEHRIRNAAGDYRWFIAHAVPQIDQRTGRLLRWYGTTTDIHEQKLAEAALRAVNEQLVQSDRQKDEFLAVLAHELRNPLAAIRNVLQLLQTADFGNNRRHFDILSRQTQMLTGLVDDLLDVSRVTRGVIELRREVVDMTAIVTRAVENVQPLIDAKRHQLMQNLPTIAPRVLGDPLRLEQIITNLLHNAAKYTDQQGHLAIDLATIDNCVELRVRDNGMGLDPALAEHIFELFGQDRRGLDRSQGGLGIGLTIVRQLVELHGGTVRAASQGVGHGAEFVVMLPLAGTGDPPAAEPATSDTPGRPIRRVLVVDDRRDVADTLTLLLESAGHQVWTAYDGPDALVAAELHQPDLVLLDIGLPGMDGYEVARQLRHNTRTRHAVLAALTGYGQPADAAQAEAAGFDAHFVKPVDFDKLEAFIEDAGARRHW